MAQDDDKLIRNALDAVDRGRRLAMVGVVALFIATVFALFTLFHIAGGPPPPGGVTLKAVFASAVSGMLLMACCTAVLMIHVTRMTKSILRAIDRS